MSLARNRDRQNSDRLLVLSRLLLALMVVLVLRALWLIVWDYRWYFPPDFEQSSFLLGRQSAFHGVYRYAFYLHIICGPPTVILATLQWIFPKGIGHRWRGRILAGLVLLAIVPSGIIMASGTPFGGLATLAFQLHGLLTAVYCVALVVAARVGSQRHSHFSIVCVAFLYAPIFFRLVSGAAIVLDVESSELYVINAWCCWLVPWTVLEWRYWLRGNDFARYNRVAESDPT